MIVNLVPYKRKPVAKTVDKYNTEWTDINDDYCVVPGRIEATFVPVAITTTTATPTVTWSAVIVDDIPTETEDMPF